MQRLEESESLREQQLHDQQRLAKEAETSKALLAAAEERALLSERLLQER